MAHHHFIIHLWSQAQGGLPLPASQPPKQPIERPRRPVVVAVAIIIIIMSGTNRLHYSMLQRGEIKAFIKANKSIAVNAMRANSQPADGYMQWSDPELQCRQLLAWRGWIYAHIPIDDAWPPGLPSHSLRSRMLSSNMNYDFGIISSRMVINIAATIQADARPPHSVQ